MGFCVISERPRTNNHCEGDHNKLARLLGVHPSIFRFIDGLKNFQAEQEVTMARIAAGEDPVARQQQYVRQDERIYRLVHKFSNAIHADDDSFLPYLESMAHNTRL